MNTQFITTKIGTVRNTVPIFVQEWILFTLEDVAKGIYLNKYLLSRRFKAATGQTVVEYINTYRCLRAARLLEDGISVGEAARACGFSNDSFFSKTFCRYMGKLPKDWKK